jgi:NhaA family Na+:H+ antiporter
MLAGIGFTMALFIGNLAITDPTLLSMQKISILIASVVSCILGVIVLRMTEPVEVDLEEFEC